MRRTLSIILVMCLLSSAGLGQVGQVLPRLEGATLNDQKIVLPDPSHYHAIVLVLGFSHKSADQTEAWGKRLARDYSSQPLVGYFEVPVLQSAPGMVPADDHPRYAEGNTCSGAGTRAARLST
jgi:hypothetical protein